MVTPFKFWLDLRHRLSPLALVVLATLAPLAHPGEKPSPKPAFQTSDRCLACHNGITAPSGKDVSIGFAWRSSIMANSSRDPYWQGSVRRETLDHPESRAHIEDECSICHMPIVRYEAKESGHTGEVFSHLPFNSEKKNNAAAEDGVSCSVCHQISKKNLGTRESFNGGFVVEPALGTNAHPEYGPFAIQPGQQRIMDTSSGGFLPEQGAHIRDSALCGSCHTLTTAALGKDGKEIGRFPEQMPYQEWLHSDYSQKQSCQSCHMPLVGEDAPIAKVLGIDRPGVRQHVFVGGNFFLQRLLNQYRADLSVAALPQELSVASQGTIDFLQSQTARVTIRGLEVTSGNLDFDVLVENLTGHKFPTAYPSRRAWLHILVRDRDGKAIFESGGLNSNGSIRGNDNDDDPGKFEAHYSRITTPDQVEIYEPILKDETGHVTTGLLSAVGYAKDNRLLPSGFNKRTADPEIAVVGEALDDPNFTDAGDVVHYSVALTGAEGPFHVDAELWYQPIGFRWAHNLAPYNAPEPQRFVNYYDSMSTMSGTVIAHSEATR